jgi:predicted nucleic acid-binding protein
MIDADDPYHEQCVRAAQKLPVGLITTWPCLTEAMHFLYRAGGLKTQNVLWRFIANGAIRLVAPMEDDTRRIHDLMNQYDGLPLDLADATLVCAAEQLRERQLFTIDSALRAIQLIDGTFLDIVP